ncbi:M24 family metallopeptidase [Ancylobacter defluvii]|uniref:Xaa-Pro dipeptidase n=1 Tax=Ancylobacter defluvii TaxID=1282440 RepID=A0A9W6K1M1_9HYPH|nr:Xaa-Pro peptidase family protein [Ancylobacter defluvii]MBS7588179.1 aminopeptidase P family protein [Ancylobacter defluvii]GLK86571.1 Xaa-Pro dipeptidase [Ancylobacter defluvii]
MSLHFTTLEFERRKNRLLAAMAERQLDGMLMFQQESMYWLTGYDTFGFCFFQSLWLGADGRFALLTRSADLRQAQHTSLIEDIRIWRDAADSTPQQQLRDMVADLGGAHARIGVEYDSYGLTAANGRKLDAAFDGFAILDDASGLVDYLRAVKSEEEIFYVRKAGQLALDARQAAIELIGAGVDEGDILAAMQGAIFKGGGDYPGNEFIIGSARDALLCRYKSGRRRLDARDQITLEWAGTYRHYHAAMMETAIVGRPRDRHIDLFNAARLALEACAANIAPGRTAGEVFAAHAQVMDGHGLAEHRLAACGYSLGAKFTPSWMDPPMFYEGNPWVLEPGMVMFAHMILMDSETETAMCLGRTFLVTINGNEPLTGAPLDLIVNSR